MTKYLYFTATNGTGGMELWRVSASGKLSLAKNIVPGALSSDPTQFMASGTDLFFVAYTPTTGSELWKIDGDGSIKMLADLEPGAGSPNIAALSPVSGSLFFQAFGQIYFVGSDDVPYFLADVDGSGQTNPHDFISVGPDDVYFTATTDATGTELWRMGANGIPELVGEPTPGPLSSNPSNFTVFGGTLYFTADDKSAGNELFRIRPDGTPGVVRDINPHSADSNPSSLFVFKGELYFGAKTAAHGHELWKVKADGKAVEVADINPNGDSHVTEFTPFKGSLYFTAIHNNDREIWRVRPDGTVGQVADINTKPGAFSAVQFLKVFNDAIYFSADDGVHGDELWKLTADGKTSLVADLQNGPVGSSPAKLAVVGNALYFCAITAEEGIEMWRLSKDGKLTMVSGLNSGPASSLSGVWQGGVIDLFSPPTITSNGGGKNASLSIKENTLAVTTVAVTDPDGTAGRHYALSGNDAAFFAIGSGGKLRFKAAPDFEHPADYGANNIYNVKVTVIDNTGETDSQNLAIKITDVKGIAWAGTGGGDDRIGTPEADSLNGAGGDDTLAGGGGKDTMDGGAGRDIASYADKTGAVAVTLAGGQWSPVEIGGVVEDTIRNFEGLAGGWSADRLTGDGGANRLEGNVGNDTLKGAGGADTLVGGKGNDLLRGGGGADKFVFNLLPGPSNADRIADFTHDSDLIVLDHAVFKTIGSKLDAAEFFAGAGATAGHDANDRIIYDTDTGRLYFDADGNKAGGQAAILFATLINAPSGLDAGDFAIV